MSVHKKPKDLVAYTIRNPDADNADENAVGPRCEALDFISSMFTTRCQRAEGHKGKHWSREFSADGDGSFTSEWADNHPSTEPAALSRPPESQE